QSAKEARKTRDHALLGQQFFDSLGLSPDSENRKVAIRALDEVADGGNERGGFSRGPQFEMSPASGQGNINHGVNLAPQVVVLCVAYHPDDLPNLRLRLFDVQAFSARP